MKFGISAATLSILLMAGSAAGANPVTLSIYAKDRAWAERFDAIFGKTPKPGWLRDATESEAVAVTLDGKLLIFTEN